MASITDILVRIGADITDLKSGVSAATSLIEEIGSPISGVVSAFQDLGEAVIAAFAVKKIAEFIESIDEVGTKILHLSEILGMTTEEVSTLEYAAKALDLSNLSQGFERLENNMVKAREGVAAQSAAYIALGISLNTANGQEKTALQIVAEVADAFKNMADGQDKVNLAIAIGGRGFANMIPLLNLGKDGMDEFRNAAERAGTVMNKANSEEFEKTKLIMTELGQSFVGVGISIMERLEPALDTIMQVITNLIEDFNSLLRENSMVSAAFDLLNVAVGSVAAAFQVCVSAVEILWNGLVGVVVAGTQFMITAIKSVNAALHLDFTGVKEAWSAGIGEMQAGLKSRWDAIVADASAANDAVNSAVRFGGPKPDEKKTTSGGKSDAELAQEGTLLAAAYAKQHDQLINLNTSLGIMRTDLAAAQREAEKLKLDGADPSKIDAANKRIELMSAGIKEAQKAADKIEFDPVVKKSREAAEAVAADWTGTRTGLLQKQITVLNEYLQQVKGHGDQEIDIQREINEKKAALHRAEASDAKKGEQEALQDYRSTIQQKLAAAKGNLPEQRKIIDEAVTYMEQAGRVENSTYRSLKQEQVKIDKEIEIQKQQIAKDSLNTRVQILKLELQEQKIIDSDKVAIGDMTNREMIASELRKVDEIFKAEQQLLNEEKALYTEGSLEYEKVQNKITLLSKQHQIERDQIVHEGVQKQIQEYQKLASGIGNLFSSTISSMLTTQQTWQQGMMGILNKIANEFANFIGQMIEKWILHELAKTASTATQSQIRNAINATESDSLIGLIFKAIGEWLFGETAKTAASAAGATAAITTSVAEKAAYASEGATAAGASVAAIPLIGWAMVPEVYASTLALLSAPLDVGAWNVPSNLMAPLHAGEMVVPQTFAQGLRSSGFGGSGGDSSGGGGSGMNVNINVNAIDTQSGMAFLKSHSNTLVKTLQGAMRNGAKFA